MLVGEEAAVIHPLNNELAARFDEIAQLLAEQDASAYRVEAYRRGAEALRGLSRRFPASATASQDISTITSALIASRPWRRRRRRGSLADWCWLGGRGGGDGLVHMAHSSLAPARLARQPAGRGSRRPPVAGHVAERVPFTVVSPRHQARQRSLQSESRNDNQEER